MSSTNLSAWSVGMSSSVDIDLLDERNRWMDLSAEMMAEEDRTSARGEKGGEQGTFEGLLDDSVVPYHHRGNSERSELEEDLLDAVGR